jgi:MoxR-like ATPase
MASAPSPEPVPPADLRVLVIDDDKNIRVTLAACLEGMGCRVNCPTLSEDLLASELFGHARGAFTGAVRDQPGRVEAAEGGTLFLDEIAEVVPSLQAKLLRFLQDKEFERIGENRTRRADVRIVAASNRDLSADVAAGRFREDLYWRLAVVEIRVPPLRERPEDVLRLARRFLTFSARAAARRPQTLSPAAERALAAHDWPGNVRELRNAMERWHRRLDALAQAQALRALRRLRGRRGPRQREPEERAAAGRPLDADLAAVHAHHVARDGEADAGAPGSRAREPHELLEDARPMLGGDAGALVGHLEAQEAVGGRGAHPHAAARRRVADRVLDQVREHELHALGVRLHGIDGQHRVDLQLDAALLRHGPHRAVGLAEQVIHPDRLALELDAPGL